MRSCLREDGNYLGTLRAGNRRGGVPGKGGFQQDTKSMRKRRKWEEIK